MRSRYRRFSGVLSGLLAVVLICAGATNALGQVIDFESLFGGQALFGIDFNDDAFNDVEFSTTDPLGFNTGGPNPDDQVFASGVVLESTSTLDPDIRVEFLGGAIGSVGVGFVLLTGVDDAGQGLQLDVFDSTDELIGTVFGSGEILAVTGNGGVSGFPEGTISVSFDGVAAYALLDATTTGTRFAIDNFNGTFQVAAIPEPSGGIFLMLAGLLLRRRVALFG